MGVNDIKTNLAAVTDFTVTNLHTMAGGRIWQSGNINDPEPHHDQVMISFSLLCDPAVAAEDKVNFYWANADEHAAEIIDAALPDTEAQIAAANLISDIRDICDLVFSVRIDRVNQRLLGSFIVFSPGPSWQLLIELESAGGAFGLGNIVRRRFGTPQIQP